MKLPLFCYMLTRLCPITLKQNDLLAVGHVTLNASLNGTVAQKALSGQGGLPDSCLLLGCT